MSAGRAERVLMGHLCDEESLQILVREGLPEHLIPTEALRSIYLYALDYFKRSGGAKAPSVEALKEVYGVILDDFEVDIDTEPDDSIEWAVDALKSGWIYSNVQEINKALATDIASAVTPEDRIEVLNAHTTELVTLSHEVARASTRIDVREGLDSRVSAYERRSAEQGVFYGSTLGFPEIDAHTNGIHPGELAIVAGGPKAGKSWAMAKIALEEWRRGRATWLVTLENSVEMTIDRLACLAAMVDYRAFQHGTLSPEHLERLMEVRRAFAESDVPLHVSQPELGRRAFESICAEAQTYGVDSMLIDQLTFIELGGDGRRPKHERIGDALHRLKGIITTARKPLSCILAHQINREGVKAADKVGYLEMYHLAESAEVERTADWVFGLYATRSDKEAGLLRWQTLASRREDIKNWEMTWQVAVGNLRVRSEWELAA